MGRGPSTRYHQNMHKDFVRGTLTCLKPSVLKRRINLEFPNILNIEPTNQCNLKCTYCPRRKADKGIGFMSWELFTGIIDEAADHERLIMLNLHKDGESFLHPRFMDMIRYAKKKDVAKTIHVNTNATCWNTRTIEELLDSGIDDITVSLDAAWPDTYRRDKGVNCLQKVERQVQRFFELRSKRGLHRPFVRLKIMESDLISQSEMDDFFTKWKDIADHVQVTGIHNWSGAVDDIRVTDESSKVRYPCAIMWYALVINWNGRATVCSVDWNTEINIGDIRHQSLHQVWTSGELKKVRQAQIERNYGKYGVCKDCVVWVSVGDLSNWLTQQKEFYL